MTYDGLNWQLVEVPFAAGLMSKADARARPAPFLDIARDVQFDEVGGIQTRLPFAAAAGAIVGGGSIANARRIVAYGGELVLFTSDTVYSWNDKLSAWSPRGTHLAVAVDEVSRFAAPGDQIDGDRAELAGTVIYTWVEASTVYAAAVDKTTGSVLVAPTALPGSAQRPRAIALDTRILLSWVDGSANLKAIAVDPAAPATAIGGAATTLLAGASSLVYDVDRNPTTDLAYFAVQRTTTTSYSVLQVTAALSISSVAPARTCDGPIAIAVDPGATRIQIARVNGTNVQGDLLNTTGLGDVFTAQALGAATGGANQVAAAFRSSTTAVVWWSRAEAVTGTDGSTMLNTVTTANVVGTAVTLVQHVGLASRAFAFGGSSYCWLVFARQNEVVGAGGLSTITAAGVRASVQNLYLLYRDDGLVVAQAVRGSAGGHSPNRGHLPGISKTSATTFAWMGTNRRVIDLGGGDGHQGFEARTPVDTIASFDDNRARRCARIGATLYVGGSIPLQYDGLQLSEVGFLVAPYRIEAAAVGGALPAGKYTYKSTYSAINATSEHQQSTTSIGAVLTSAGASAVNFSLSPLNVSRRVGRVAPTVEVWRTEVNPSDDSPFYLVTGKDPSVIAGTNGFIVNEIAATVVPSLGAFQDNFTDATLVTKEASPENGAVLESLAPPGAAIMVTTDTRMFLGAVQGDPDRVWYSKLRGAGQAVAFNDVLTVDIPRDGGAVTALAVMNETLIVFRRSAIYALPGAGLDDLGTGQNYGPARILSLDVGAESAEAVALTPMGVVFKSRKGWYLLRGDEPQYIGAPVAAFDAEPALSIDVIETQHQVRILTAARMLVWDYTPGINQWCEWTIADGLHACVYNGAHVYVAAGGTRTQQTSYASATYGMDVQLTVKLAAALQAQGRVRRVQPIGEYRSAHLLRVRLGYNDTPGYIDDKAWSPSPATPGAPLQFKHAPKRPACFALTVRLTAVAAGAQATIAMAAAAAPVATSPGVWQATLRARADAQRAVGELGNALTISLSFETGANLVDVRDDFAYDLATATWAPAINNVGVRVVCTPGSLSVGSLEVAIGAASALLQVSVPDPSPTKVINIAAQAGVAASGAATGGTFVTPTGESLKLTSIGLDVGAVPGLYRRLPAAQRQ